MRKLFQITVLLLKVMLKFITRFLFQNGIKIGVLCLAMIFVLKNDFNVQFNINTTNKDIIPNSVGRFSFGETLGNFLDFNKGHHTTMSVQKESKVQPIKENLTEWGNTYSNMTYHKEGQKATIKRQKQEEYIKRFKDVARSEMRKYGIPASITLAQGLIESNAGESRLSKENNNHFGLKCFSKSCKKGHCSNFTDDSHKDFFRKFSTSWDSFRAHSLLLTGKRYKALFNHGNNYEKWAYGLKKAGYATDSRYAEKLIHIIEELKLQQYDE